MRHAGFVLLLSLLAGCSSGGGIGRLGPSQPGLNVAEAALRGGAPQVALHVSSGVLKQDPANVQAWVIRGDALTSLDRLADAADAYKKALQSNPSSVGAHIGLGRVRLATDPASSEALFLEALQHDPRNTIALNDLGVARDLQGRHADAQKAYRQALGINPDLRSAQVNLALSLAMDGNPARAELLLRPLAEDPNASRKLRHDLAAVLTMAGDRAAAARILSADLSPEEVRQALAAYAAARSGAAPTGLLRAPASGQAGAAPVPAVTHPADFHPPQPTRPAAKPAAPAPRHAAAGRDVEVQFSASPSAAAAQAEWQRLEHHMPDLLAGRQPVIFKVQRDGQTFWRLRTGGFPNEALASSFCARVRAAGGACALAGG